jgi:hypothetical protein
MTAENIDPNCVKTITVEAKECTCCRCGYIWTVFSEALPETCANPGCRSRYWNKKRVRKIKGEM